jgi:hypothetical protein
MWPLNYYFFNDWHLKNMLEGNLGMFMLIFWYCYDFLLSLFLPIFMESVGIAHGFAVVVALLKQRR